MRCPTCSTEVAADSAFCPKCGARVAAPATQAAATPAERLRGGAAAAAASNEGEEPLWSGGYSAKAMYGSWIFAGVVTIAAAIALVFFPEPITWLVAGALVTVLWLALLGHFLKERLSVSYSLTSQRLIHRRGILNQQTDRIEVIDIDDVQYVQGIMERMFGVGTIKLLSSDVSDKALVMKGIDNVQHVANLLDDARREERRKRGLYMESV